MHTFIEGVQAVLSTTPQRWQQLVSALPPDLLSRPPAAGEWSALRCLQHLLDAERLNFPVRFQAFLAGRDFEAYDPNRADDDLASQGPEQLVRLFAQTRQESLTLFKHLKSEDLERKVKHPQLGSVTLAEMLHTWAAHDLMHTVQAERALMQPFMLGCGGWRPFFRDHELDTSKK